VSRTLSIHSMVVLTSFHSVEQHRLPIFLKVVLCPSGISDITRRMQINKHLVANEETHLKNLERLVKGPTYLCSGDEEKDKMRYAENFNSRGEAKIPLVWEEWFWDSLDFGGCFDEEKYQVWRPRLRGNPLEKVFQFRHSDYILERLVS
jgi:DNA replication regulator DPB11